MSGIDDTAKRRIRWLTRRGLLELDILLERFMATEFDALDQQQLQLFCEILDWPDQEFLAIVNGKQAMPDDKYQALIQRIRAA